MQALHNSLNTVLKNLRELSPMAKLLIGSLMVILVMTLFLVAQYTSRAAMEPLGLAGNISSDARARAVNYIQGRGIPYLERGNEILVPIDQKYAILAQLTDGEIISADQINFDTLVQQDSPFLSKAQNERRWLVATMNVLSQTVSHMSGVERARVVIDEPRNPGGIGRAHLPSSASVTIWTRDGSLPQSQVDAIASLVAGAHASLKPEHVSIIEARTNRAYRARSSDALSATTNLELQLSKERVVREKLLESLSYIPGINVAVSVVVDTRTITQQRRNFEEPKLGVTSERSRRIESQNQVAGGESGVRPNTGAAIAGTGRRGSSMSDERSEAAMIPAFGGTDAHITDPRGYALQINAAIGVPKSYFVNLHRDRVNDQAAQPEQTELDQLVTEETERIRAQIEPLIDTRAVDGAVAGTVMVSMIPDFALTISPAGHGPGSVQEAARFVGIGAEGMVKYVSLAGLALISLAMMFIMVRKANTREELPTASELVGVPPALADLDSEVVGEAGETAPSLEGLEINEDDLKRQQMLSQINEMAKQHPNDAAALLRRWIKAEV